MELEVYGQHGANGAIKVSLRLTATAVLPLFSKSDMIDFFFQFNISIQVEKSTNSTQRQWLRRDTRPEQDV
jgi:hypothetical protein